MSKEDSKKGGGKGKAAAGAGILVLLAAGLFKFQPFGLPFGFDSPGSGNDSSVSDDSESPKAEPTEAPTEEKKEEETSEEATSAAAEITVSGKEYLYQNRKFALAELIEEMKKLGSETEIRIYTEEDFTANAMDALKKAFDEAGIVYMVVNEKV